MSKSGVAYAASFKFEGIPDEVMEIPGLRNAIIHEFMRVYQEYCDVTNGGLIESLNDEWKDIHGKSNLYDSGLIDEYTTFMAQKFQKVVDDLNLYSCSELLEFCIGDDASFYARLKRVDYDSRIYFILEKSN